MIVLGGIGGRRLAVLGSDKRSPLSILDFTVCDIWRVGSRVCQFLQKIVAVFSYVIYAATGNNLCYVVALFPQRTYKLRMLLRKHKCAENEQATAQNAGEAHVQPGA